MSDERLGVQVLAAVKFLQQIYQDLEVMVRHADKVFADRGWIPAARNKVFARIGNRLNPKVWLLTQLFRYYVPAGKAADRMIVVVPVLDPPGGWAEPICVGISLTLATSLKGTRSLAKTRRHLRPVIDGIDGRPGIHAVEADNIPSLLNAVRAQVVVVPLCDLADEAALLTRLIEPALTAFSQVR